MAIVLGKTYLDNVLEIFKEVSVTKVLMTNPALIKKGANGKDFLIKHLTTQGPAAYGRGDLVARTVDNTWQTFTPSYDRGGKWTLDVMDAQEAMIDAAAVSAVYLREHQIPEWDAYCFSTYASNAKTLEVGTPAALSGGQAVLAAIKVGQNALDEQETPKKGRYLFINASLLRDAKGTASTGTDLAVLDEFDEVIPVPQTRFHKGITLLDGTTGGQEAGGYVKTASTGRDINFMIIQKDAVIQAEKRSVAEIIPPEINNNGDGYIFKFRNYGVAALVEREDANSKIKGVYSHIKNS